MAKKLNLGDSKLAFWKPDCQAMLPTEDKNLLEMIHMRRAIHREDINVIQIVEAEQKITQNLIHKALERVTSVSKAKGHAKEFEYPKGGDDGSLLDVLRRNRHLIVFFLEVQLGEHCRPVDS